MKNLNLGFERLEQRIAPGGCSCDCKPGEGEGGKKEKGNNGWGNGGDDPPPGNSTSNNNSQTQSKIDDVLR